MARGLSLGPDEILRRFAEAQARERWNFLAAEATFTGLLPSWSGSYELLFRLGTDAMADTPRGRAARSLVATAEAERIMRDRNVNLSHMPARSGLCFTRLPGSGKRSPPARAKQGRCWSRKPTSARSIAPAIAARLPRK